jgi:two-component sensor histidine kinase
LNNRRSFAAGLLWSSLAVVTAILLRFGLGPWVEGLPFLTFFPAVLAASLLLGWQWGVGVTVVSASAANFFFMSPALDGAMTQKDLGGTAAFIGSALLIVMTAVAIRTSVREIDEGAKREAALNTELQHRVKNNLAVIIGLASQTVRYAPDPAQFFEAFRGRLMALAEAHNVLSSGMWEESHLPDLAAAAVKPFDHLGAITLDGPRCAIPMASCVPAVLALHELGTNAVKYGALSVPAGEVAIHWAVVDGRAIIRWQETGGPAVVKPTRQGLGSRLLRKQTGLDSVTLNFAPEGVVCEIEVRGVKLID